LWRNSYQLKVVQTVNYYRNTFELNLRWIVTAGHCHESSFPLDIAVLGEHDVTVETETMIKIVMIAEIDDTINQFNL
jgi:hypothetical protein